MKTTEIVKTYKCKVCGKFYDENAKNVLSHSRLERTWQKKFKNCKKGDKIVVSELNGYKTIYQFLGSKSSTESCGKKMVVWVGNKHKGRMVRKALLAESYNSRTMILKDQKEVKKMKKTIMDEKEFKRMQCVWK